MDRAQHGAELSYSCTQLGPKSISAFKSYCSQHFQRLQSTSTATHAGNSVSSLNSQTLLEEHLPMLTISFQTFYRIVRKKSTFSALCWQSALQDARYIIKCSGGFALCYHSENALLHSCKGEEMET